MENCKIKVFESDEPVSYEFNVNAFVSDIARAGWKYDVSASVDGYFYKAVVMYCEPASSDPVFDSGVESDILLNRTKCCHCSCYQRERGQCLYFDKPVKFAGTICDHFETGRVKV